MRARERAAAEQTLQSEEAIFRIRHPELGVFRHQGLQLRFLGQEPFLQLEQPDGQGFGDLGEGPQLTGQPLGAICDRQLNSHADWRWNGRMVSAPPPGAKGEARAQPPGPMVCNDSENLGILTKQTHRIPIAALG